jgi:transcriptional regulator with XRE-family HTH domain
MSTACPLPAPQAARSPGPAEHRRNLGTTLRQLREQRSLRLEDAACHLGIAPSTLSRIETGKAPTRTSYLTLLLDLYDIHDAAQRRRLTDLAREGQRKGWQDDYRDIIITPAAATYYGLETAADLIRVYAPHAIPDLLQVPGYAHAACRATRPGLTPAQARRHAAITATRSEHLNPGHHLHAIIDQTALTRPIAPPRVMATQLDHLHAAATSPACTIQITPLPAAPLLSPPFTILTLPAGPDTAAYTSPAGHLTATTRPRDIQAMHALFTALAKAAATPAQSAELIAQLTSPPQRATGNNP